MFEPDDESPRSAAAPEAAPGRPGFPFDPRRLGRALWDGRKWLVALTLFAAVLGIVLGKFVVKKTYSASATVLWEPPDKAASDAVRQLSTLSQSVKLPDTMMVVRSRLALTTNIDELSSRVDVKLGENSMLITVTAKAGSSDEASDLANAVVDAFLAQQKDLAAARLRETVKALRDSLTQTEKAQTDARKRYDDFRVANKISDMSVDVQRAIEEVARLRVAANDARVELQSLQAREGSLRASRDASPGSVVASRTEQRPELARLAAAEAELAQARATFTPDHPKVKALEAEVEALRTLADDDTAVVTGEVVTRSPLRDSLATSVEELAALRKSIEQRNSALDDIIKQSEVRASKLTSEEAEAARLLADVQVGEAHVNLLLKQIGSSEDDVRSATSGFQVVSRATPPAHPANRTGRTVAIAAPVATLFLVAFVLMMREVSKLRLRSASEVAYWLEGPVLWATPWPRLRKQESRELSREVADAMATRAGVIGLTTLDTSDAALDLAKLLRSRLVQRGATCAVTDQRAREVPKGGLDLADALEHPSFGEELAELRLTSSTVLVILPSMREVASVRAARRWLDALVVLVPSGAAKLGDVAGVRKALSLTGPGLAAVLIDAPEWLLSRSTRAAGDPATLWHRRGKTLQGTPSPPPVA